MKVCVPATTHGGAGGGGGIGGARRWKHSGVPGAEPVGAGTQQQPLARHVASICPVSGSGWQSKRTCPSLHAINASGGEGGGGEGGGDEGGGGVGIDGGDCDGMFDSRPDICRAGCCSVLAMSRQSDVVEARIYNLHSLALG